MNRWSMADNIQALWRKVQAQSRRIAQLESIVYLKEEVSEEVPDEPPSKPAFTGKSVMCYNCYGRKQEFKVLGQGYFERVTCSVCNGTGRLKK